MVVLTSLPDNLHSTFLDIIQVLHHAFVDRPGTKRTTYNQNGLLLRIESETLNGFCLGHLVLQQSLTYRIASHDDFLGREETLHSFVGNTNLISLFCQQFVGHTCIGILFLNQTGNAHCCGFVECRATGIATHAHCGHRTEVLDNLLGHTLAFPYLEKNFYVLQQILAVESLNGETFYFITSRGDALHLHSAESPYKENLCIRMLCLDGIGNGNSWEDVPSRAAAADDNP